MSSNSNSTTKRQVKKTSDMSEEERKKRFGSHTEYGTRAYLAAHPYDQLYIYLELKKDPTIDLVKPLKVLLHKPKRTSSKLLLYHENFSKIIESYGTVEDYVKLQVYVTNTCLMIAYVFVHILKAVPYYSAKLWGGDNVTPIRAVVQELYCKPISSDEPANSPDEVDAQGNMMTVEYNSTEFHQRVATLQKLLNKEAMRKVIIYIVENGAEAIPMEDKDKGWLLNKFKLFLEDLVKRSDEMKKTRRAYRDAITKVIDERAVAAEYFAHEKIPVVTYFRKTITQTIEQCDWSDFHKFYKPPASETPLGQIVAKDYTIFKNSTSHKQRDEGLGNGAANGKSGNGNHASTDKESARDKNMLTNEKSEIDGVTNNAELSDSATTRKSNRKYRKKSCVECASDSDSDSSEDAVLNLSKKSHPNGSTAHDSGQGGRSKIVTGAAANHHSAHFPESSITVLHSAAIEMLEKVSISTEQSVSLTTTSDCQSFLENNEINVSTQVPNSIDGMSLISSAKQGVSNRNFANGNSTVEQTTKSLQKRPSTSSPSHEEPSTKRAKNSDDSSNTYEQILQVYNVSRSKEEFEQEISRILCHNPKSNSSSPSEVLCLQNTLLQLSKMYNRDDFAEVVLKTISDQLDASKVLDILKIDDLRRALLARKSDSSFVRKELLRTSANEIINHVSTKNDWNDSGQLLQMMLEGFSQIALKDSNLDLEETVGALINATSNVVKSKKYIKSFQQFLGIILQSGSEILTDETKNILKNFILQNFSRSDVAELINDILLPKGVIHID